MLCMLYVLYTFVILFCLSLGKSTMTVVSFSKYEWFEEWKDDKVKNRRTDYKELKQTFIDSVLGVVLDVFPKISSDKVKFLNRF